LAMAMMEQTEKPGVEIVNKQIANIEFEKCVHTVTTSDTEFAAKTVIICAGAGPRKLGAIGEKKFDGRNIHYCALCDGAFYKDRDIVVVGGGNSAVEEVLYLSPIVKSITIVNVTEDFAAHAVSLNAMAKLPNVIGVHHLHSVKEISGEKNLESITIKHTGTGVETVIPCDGVFVAIGRAPSTALFKGKLDLSRAGYVKTNPKMETNIEGVYAAGDIREKHVRQIVTACADGAVAATFAAMHLKQCKLCPKFIQTQS